MKKVTLRDKLADIVKQEFIFYSIFERLGVNNLYKDLTINDACEINGINKNFFLIVVNTYINNNYTPLSDAISFPVKDLVKYLINTHRAYDISFIPRIRELFSKIMNLDPGSGVKYVSDIFLKTQKKFIQHYKEENDILFPAIISRMNDDNSVCNIELVELIDSIEKGKHQRFLDAIEDLLSIFIKYVKPNCKREIVELLVLLDTFSKDMTHHMIIEDRYLYSRIKSGINE